MARNLPVIYLAVSLALVPLLWLVTLFVRSADSQDGGGGPIQLAKNVKIADWLEHKWLCWDVSLVNNYLRMDQMIAITIRPSYSEIVMSSGDKFRVNVPPDRFAEALGVYFLDKAKQEQLP